MPKTTELIIVDGPLGLWAEVWIEVTFDVEPSEPRTFDYPGWRGGACNLEFRCETMKVYDVDGNPVKIVEDCTEAINLFETAKLKIPNREWEEICEASLPMYE